MSVVDVVGVPRAHDPWEAAARRFEGRGERVDRWSPLDLAQRLDRRMIRTGPLDLVDEAVRRWIAGELDRVIVVLPPQEGKGLDITTPIPTPDGWTLMGDLRPGDRVIGGDGKPCTVTYVSDVHHLDCYRLTFQDGSTLVADGDHRWRVWDRSGYDAARYAAHDGPEDEKRRAASRSWKVVDTRELLQDPRRYAVPGNPVVDLPDRDDLPLPPYVLGVWLGDGDTDSAGFTCADDEIVKQLAAEGWPVRKTPSSNAIDWTWAAPRGDDRRGAFKGALRALDVVGAKHVPSAYLRAGYTQRLALLQGLMDTDGSCYFNGTGYSACEFMTIREGLARDVLTLARSLGIRACLKPGRATLDGRDVGPRYRVKFTTDLPVFRLTRKLDRLYGVDGPRKVRERIGVKSVEPVETVPTRCITVDSPDSTYLAGWDLVVTHNTQVARYGCFQALRYDPLLRIGVASYSDRIARRIPRWVRNDITAYPGLGLRLAPDQKAAHDWRLVNGIGGMYAAGIGGSWSGQPVDRFVVDDVFKDRQDADSEVSRENVWDWWTSTATARLSEGGAVLIINTRWHHDDLIGRLLKRDPDGWHVVRIPAQADPEVADPDPLGRAPGEFMESARGRTAESWERRKREADHEWEPVYQGNPAPPGGSIFDPDGALRWWTLDRDGTRVGTDTGRWWPLRDCARYATIDTASSVSRTADWTVVSAWAVTPDNQLLLLDVRRDRVPEAHQIDLARPLVERWSLRTIHVEATMAGTRLVRAATADGLHVEDLKAEKSKVVRAGLASKMMSQGRVWFPKADPRIQASQDPMLPVLLTELREFPNGRHDDFVDTLAYGAAVAWDTYVPPPPSSAPAVGDAVEDAISRALPTAPVGDFFTSEF